MTADLEPFRRSVVRVLAKDDRFVGLGLRLADGIIVTCAHVIGKALNYDACCKAPPQGGVKVHAAAPANVSEDLGLARVIEGGWFPKRNWKPAEEPADIAILRLEKDSALSFKLPPISVALTLSGFKFSLLGAQNGHGDNLVPIYGSIGQQTSNGRYLLFQESTYRIEPGCSGAPVCDKATGQVIGLVVQEELNSSTGIAFLIAPGELLVALDRAGLSAAARAASPMDLIRGWVGDGVDLHDLTLGRRLRQFIDAYSGTAEQPLPFVGRDKELVLLREWLAGGGLFFVTGSAGRGKSALLVHFISHVLAQQHDVIVLFVPISIRFETASELTGLRLLYLQLSALFAELRLPSAPAQSDYYDCIGRGWNFIRNRPNRRFLLVIDGVDEASGGWIEWNVLPYQLPANLAVVVSARSADARPATPSWLTNIRRHDGRGVACGRVDLPLLSRGAVKDAVVQLGHPLDEIAEREAVMDELYRLSDWGDPLLVSLWVGQLWRSRDQRRLQTAAHLKRLSPGIGGFLDIWFEEQERLWKFEGLNIRREGFEPLLHLFSIAQGTLTAPDIVSLVARYRSQEARWDPPFLERVLNSASRLLVRSVSAETEAARFSFVHPRLAFHYQAALKQCPEVRLRLAFIEWGKETVERLNRSDLPPEECPAYLLHHYVWHVQDAMDRRLLSLEQALDCHLLLLVLKPGWHRAWFRTEEAYGGFLGDVSRVEQTLRLAASPRNLGKQLYCLLCEASIRSLTSNIPPSLFAQLIDCRIWSVTRALKTIQHLEPPN